jgi:aromatic ring-opening dioxygenase catalytic subunit (LigB family)
MWDGLAAYLRGIDDSLGMRPKAALVISGHWETPLPTLNVAEKPHLLFDYYGFPEHTYRLKYPVAGAPTLAQRVRDLLEDAGFVPFLLVYPNADVPILQLSLQRSLDPELHLRIGKALAPLRDQGVLIVGSGMSYHNLAAMFSGGGAAASVAFDTWLNEAVLDTAAREEKLIAWRSAPGGRESHPREEHLIPLMVAAGAATGDTAVRTFSDSLAGKAISGFRFG